MKQADVFRTLLKDIEIYFNKDLTDHQARFYWNECGHWHRPDFERGLKELMRTKRPIPSNFPTPRELNDMVTAMGGKTAAAEEHIRTRCHTCYDTGYLWVDLKREDYEWSDVYLCGHCENWKNEDLTVPGFKGATMAWKSRSIPRITMDQFDLDIVGRYRRKGIEAKLIRNRHVDKARRENDKRFGISEGMTVEACVRKEQSILNPVADGSFVVGKDA